jgi:hypothetical protein
MSFLNTNGHHCMRARDRSTAAFWSKLGSNDVLVLDSALLVNRESTVSRSAAEIHKIMERWKFESPGKERPS